MNSDKHETYFGDTSCLQWEVVRLSKDGEKHCGDMYYVRELGGKVLVAVIDGIGHGEAAEYAGIKAVNALDSYSGDSLISCVNHCHNELKQTRGVVMSLALFDPSSRTMTWISVGNVNGVLVKASSNLKSENIILRGGIVGYKLPELRASVFPVEKGDLLILTTDGVHNTYAEQVPGSRSISFIARYISSGYAKYSDDALVLVARYREEWLNE